MDGHQYEHAVANYLKHHGFSNVKVTRASGDYGADITASKRGKKYAIQCKYYTNPVGLKAVQEVVAAKKHYRCSKAAVVTNNTFTGPAKKLAEENGVILMDKITPRMCKSSGVLNKLFIFMVVLILGASAVMIIIAILMMLNVIRI